MLNDYYFSESIIIYFLNQQLARSERKSFEGTLENKMKKNQPFLFHPNYYFLFMKCKIIP